MYRVLRLAIAVSLSPIFLLAADEYATESAKLTDLMGWKPGKVIAEIGAGEPYEPYAAGGGGGAAEMLALYGS